MSKHATRRRRDGGIEIVIEVSDEMFDAADKAMTGTPRQLLDNAFDSVAERYRRLVRLSTKKEG